MPPPPAGDSTPGTGSLHAPAESEESDPPGEPSGTRGSSPAGALDVPRAADVDVRPLRALEEYRACVQLQKATWGDGFSEVVPLALLKVGQRIGGVTAGAFDEDGRLLGFVFGLTGVEEGGRLVHWSDMLAVRQDCRNRGIGRRLKEFQRDQVRARGVKLIYWTFDPLVARNAHLNLSRLGARVREYLPDMYGSTDSPLHQGLGTDRFVVAWAVERTGSGDAADRSSSTAPEGARLKEAPIVNPGPHGGEVDLTPARSGARRVRVRIPPDIQAVQAQSLGSAGAWRRGTREALMGLMALGYRVIGFQRDGGTGTCGYVLAPTDGEEPAE